MWLLCSVWTIALALGWCDKTANTTKTSIKLGTSVIPASQMLVDFGPEQFS